MPRIQIYDTTLRDGSQGEGVNFSLHENLRMIADSVRYCKGQLHVAEVIYDAEHFFDGFKANPDYAIKTLKAALDGGAKMLILCDTNGGTLPEDVAERVAKVRAALPGV